MYLLDTDISSYIMKRSDPPLIERVKGFAAKELKVSSITAFELEYGARKSDRYESLIRVINAFLDNVEVLPLTLEAAREAGAIRADLTATGKSIGAYDLLIAGHARALGAILVTNNVDEFSRVRDLSIENWARD
jgi:tRNA(fMet)-specific endonuclease VapC